MDLVERYMAAIRRNLPTAKADDIAAEIAEDLQSRREDREDALGRPLTDEETSAMLRNFGHPLVVAGRFRSHQYLIGPEVYPFYLQVMKIVLAAGVALLAGVAIVNLVAGNDNLFAVLARAKGDLLFFLLLTIAVVTILFAVLERAGFPADHLAKWRPDQLPDPFDRQRKQWESALEVGLGLAFLLWWTGVVKAPQFGGADRLIEPAPIWADFYVPILVLASLQLLVNLVRWLRPRWKIAVNLFTIVICAAAVALIAALMKAESWVVATQSGNADLVDSVNMAIQIGLLATAVVITLQAMGELYKLFKSWRGRAG